MLQRRDDSPELCLIGILGEPIIDDGWEEETKAVEPTEDCKVRRCSKPNLDVENSALDLCPVEAFVRRTLLTEPESRMLFLTWRKELGGFDGVG